MKVSLVVPCFNEAENLPVLINRCERLIAQYPVEVILADNGSTDDSSSVIKKCPHIKLVRVDKNEG